MDTELNVLSMGRGFWGVRLPKSQQGSNRDFPTLRGKTVILHWVLKNASKAPPTSPQTSRRRRRLLTGICSGQLDEKNPSALISSGLLVQADEGVSLPVVDLIDKSTAAYREVPVSS
ncbi:tetratricopeptide repeat protein 7A-like [Dorcoceras hygrometricum]|uniref:Tetratricopeptide repeat protein 7A-like n=1 Tax=Dorcoceras hygrometricum TaxID=472368 RepID=A0A2Z6ZTL4_9LAMI|nr:tetratricopeptide repeat protein 7A-like [Dorcoceras hygrometricum]